MPKRISPSIGVKCRNPQRTRVTADATPTLARVSERFPFRQISRDFTVAL